MSNLWTSFTDYIINNYRDSEKIVEVGVGRVLEPSNILKKELPTCNIELVDIYPANESVVMDDITDPEDYIYEGADLIYAVRPPEELQNSIFNLGVRYDADIIIKPLFTEEISYNLQNKLKLVNYKRSVFYEYKRK
ncbi:UPF0146 family protein [Methanosphaera sp. ISO3-F5]|uniref:UPF0146 family protein n=1 Tax=Methanosphaera sp. ISO3-F5 TaxID=1452353 RepID=UPI002B260D9D|nr:UPF0146 family protein [Methanosphaera sp. ISO3-F5]WQH64508.1 UPF0146 family protein [Methanosphaera sp. ISO3-F5]